MHKTHEHEHHKRYLWVYLRTSVVFSRPTAVPFITHHLSHARHSSVVSQRLAPHTKHLLLNTTKLPRNLIQNIILSGYYEILWDTPILLYTHPEQGRHLAWGRGLRALISASWNTSLEPLARNWTLARVKKIRVAHRRWRKILGNLTTQECGPHEGLTKRTLLILTFTIYVV